MKGLLWLLALFAAAVGVSLAARFNEGYVLLVFPPYRAEVSLNLALIGLIGGFALCYGALRGISLTFALPRQVRAYRERLRREKATGQFHDAIRLLFEGRFSQSLKMAALAHESGLAPGLAALVAARAAQRLREPEKQETWLERASRADAKLQAARLMLEAEQLIEMRRFEDAVLVLAQLQRLSGRHIAALRLELRAQQGCGRWDEVLRIARQLEKRAALLPELATEIKFKAHRENIRLRRSDRAQLLAYLRALPADENNARLVLEFAEALLLLEAQEEAQRIIERQLDSDWDPALVRLYGRCVQGDVAALNARIARADQWLAVHPYDPQLLLALGRLCLAQRLWGKAQTYLEASLSLEDSREVRLELAHLFEQTSRTAESMQHYRAAVGQLG